MTTIALNKLIPAKANVRRTGATDGIEELAASIAAHGLLTSLTVRKSARGKFAVIAGRRRYLALNLLAERDQATEPSIPYEFDPSRAARSSALTICSCTSSRSRAVSQRS
jgi:ParB-like nuclease domain